MLNGEILKEIRKRTGLTQKQFAEIYKIPYRTIQNWENGVREMKDYEFELLHRCVSADEEEICEKLAEDETLIDGWRNYYNTHDFYVDSFKNAINVLNEN